MKKEYNYSKLMWIEIGRYCVNSKGNISLHIPMRSKNPIEEGAFKILHVKKIEFESCPK